MLECSIHLDPRTRAIEHTIHRKDLIENEENLQLAEKYTSELGVFKASLRAFQPYKLDQIKRPINSINKENLPHTQSKLRDGGH